MKLRNLLFGTMIAMAFTACSSDNDPVIDNGGQEEVGAATLSLQLNGIATKADPTDADLQDLTVCIFGATTAETKLVSATAEQIAAFKIEDIELTSGPKKIVVLANVGTLTAADYAALAGSDPLEYINEAFADFSMNSQVFDVTLARGENYLGYGGNTADYPGTHLATTITKTEPVKLYRNVAKINLSTVQVFENVVTEGEEGGAPRFVKYDNPKLEVTEVFILNASKESKLFDVAQWGSTYIKSSGVFGVDYETYEEWEAEADNAGYFPAVAEANFVESGLNSGTLSTTVQLSDGPKAMGNVFYVYSNEAPYFKSANNNPTLLVVKGNFSYDDDNEVGGRQIESNRYYSIELGKVDYSASTALETDFPGITGKSAGLYRNLQYNIALGVKGPGSHNPLIPPPAGDDANLNVWVKVVNFGDVSQPVVID